MHEALYGIGFLEVVLCLRYYCGIDLTMEYISWM